MIVADASALLAVYLAEPERRYFISKIRSAEAVVVSPVNAWETFVRAQTVNGDAGRLRMERLLRKLGVQIVDIDADTARLAADAFARFRGRPARLNMGDCFAYALAKSRNAPLLFKGDDFANTDIAAA